MEQNRVERVSGFMFRSSDVYNECVCTKGEPTKSSHLRDQSWQRHLLITHSFLLKGGEPPVCIGYNERLTTKHVLLVQILLKQEKAVHSSITGCTI